MRQGEAVDWACLPEVLSVPEVAEILRLSRSQAYEYIQQGLIPCIRFGKAIRISKAALRRWLNGEPVCSVVPSPE